jgi:curli biogenesis system outer membrane secretion channel CsgG
MKTTRMFGLAASVAALTSIALGFAGCATTSETAKPAATPAMVAAPPIPLPATNQWKPKVGVPPFKVVYTSEARDASGVQETKRVLAGMAAEQLTTLAVKSQRFAVYERAQLEQLLAEQRLTNVVHEGTLVRSGKIRGVDYLLFGQITNFRITAQKSSGGIGGLGGLIPGLGTKIPQFDFKNKKSKIIAECAVDLRLVDPQTGRAIVADYSEFKKIDSIGGMGISVEGFKAESDGELTTTQDDNGKILRLALDDALRKMIPDLDKEFLAHVEPTPSAITATAAPSFWGRIVGWFK